jgi:ATP-dependent Clp protease protease subunit
LAIYDAMEYVRPEVATFCMGEAASMAAFLLAAGAKGKRYVLPRTRLLIHQPSSEFRGKSSDVDIHAKEVLRSREQLDQLLAKHTGQPLDRVRMDTERDYFMSAIEAKAYGLVDIVITEQIVSVPR